eukprot:scaffold657598_cov57-Prasinocladus_malaysianus.AAC.1
MSVDLVMTVLFTGVRGPASLLQRQDVREDAGGRDDGPGLDVHGRRHPLHRSRRSRVWGREGVATLTRVAAFSSSHID